MRLFTGSPVLGVDGGEESASEASIKATSMGEKWARSCVENGGASQAWFAQIDDNLNVDWVSGWPSYAVPMFGLDLQEKVLKDRQSITLFYAKKSINIGIFPILHKDQPLGLLAIHSPDSNFFSSAVTKWIETLAVSISYSLVQMRKAAKCRQVTNSINRILQSSQNLKDDLPLVLDILADAVKADTVLVYRRNRLQSRYDLLAAYGLNAHSVEGLSLCTSVDSHTLTGKAYELVQFESLDEKSKDQRQEHFFNRGCKSYIALPLIINWDVLGILEIFWRPYQEDKDKLNIIKMVGGTISWAIEHTSVMSDLKRRNDELTSTYTATIEGLSRALELRDLETEGHTKRVGELTLRLANHMQIPQEQHIHLLQGALLHDIGKLGIPDAILLKPGSLSPQEWDVMKQHPLYAYNILAPIISLKETLDIPLYHHEHWDGSGYPFGLKGDKIPISARLFTIVDVFDALTSDRPYRSAWSHSQTVAYIREQSGELFDPQIVRKFLELIDKGS